MVIKLTEVLDSELMRRAEPRVRAARSLVDNIHVRWVHSSEVLQIAGLLRGGELLLTGGEALLALKPAAQRDYIQKLAERRVSALAVQTAGLSRPLTLELIEAAKEFGLPLIELQQVVPFVDLAEEVNRRIVSRQATALQMGDAISQQLAERLAASGSELLPLLELIAEKLSVYAVLTDRNGSVLASAGASQCSDGPESVEVDIFIANIVAAKLTLQHGSETENGYLLAVGERVSSILALALTQRHRPSLAQIADTDLMRAIVLGSSAEQIREMCNTVALPVDEAVLMLVFKRSGLAPVQSITAQPLRRCCPGVRTYLDGENLYALYPLGQYQTRRKRSSLLTQLRTEFATLPVTGVLGPTVDGPLLAPWSLREAKLAHTLGPTGQVAAGQGSENIWDSENFVAERLASRDLSAPTVQRLVQEMLGELIDYDRRRGTLLTETLDRWLELGCNTAETARVLFLERQSVHNRLTKIFELLGGDPRGTGKMAGLHLAARLAHGQVPLNLD